MTLAPLIGLPGRRKRGSQVDGFAGPLSGLDIDIYLADYARGIIEAGGIPVHIPMDVDPVALLPHLHGLLFTGGADMAPSLYGQEAAGSSWEPERDQLEISLLEAALDQQLPVLGVCRGLQLLNVVTGGSLHQDVPEHSRYDVPVDAEVHRVAFEPGTRLAEIYGTELGVNTLHHQTVDRVGQDLAVTARSTDGTVEGLELAGHDVIAVQWHPEMMSVADPIFSWLVKQALHKVKQSTSR